MAPAAVKATYSDLKLIKGRKVAVVCLEIPIEQAESFVAAFGMPNPAEEKWVAIARLKSEAEPESAEPKSHKRFADLKPSAQAALLCEKPAFRTFLMEELGGLEIVDSEDAAAFLRAHCRVSSRAEFDKQSAGTILWLGVRDKFDAWSIAG